MPNIFTQVCGLAIIVLLIYLSGRTRKVGLLREYLFAQILGITALTLCLDVLSLFAIQYESVFTPLVTHIICKLYLIGLATEGVYAVLYTSNIIFSRRTNHRVVKGVASIHIIYGILIFILPLEYVNKELEIYSYGPGVNMTYGFVGLFILLGIILTYVPSVELTKPHRRAIRTWLAAWIIAAMIQFFNPQILLSGFASAFGVLVIFCALENPDSRIDRNTGAYNESSCREFIKRRFELNRPYAMIVIVLEHGKNISLTPMQHDEASQKFAEFLFSLGKYRVFCDAETDFQILLEDASEVETVLAKIKERFSREWILDGIEEGVNYDPRYIVLEDSSILNDVGNHFFVIHQMIHHFPVSDTDTFYVDEYIVKDLADFELIKQEIKLALEEDRVEPYYQPIYGIEDGRFTAAESLARIRNKDGSLMPPGIFIPVAEVTGLVKLIDERVFEKCCKLLSSENLAKIGMKYIELNVSVTQCEDPELYNRYVSIMEKYNVDPTHINLEVTESSKIQQKNVLIGNIEKFREKGVKFSLDDFGTGQSNLDYIISMPVDIIKFDMSMTRSYFENEKTRIVMKNTVNMIDEMGLHVVIEGVETKEQFEEFCKLPVDFIQGYYFSRPISAGEFVKFLEEHNK